MQLRKFTIIMQVNTTKFLTNAMLPLPLIRFTSSLQLLLNPNQKNTQEHIFANHSD